MSRRDIIIKFQYELKCYYYNSDNTDGNKHYNIVNLTFCVAAARTRQDNQKTMFTAEMVNWLPVSNYSDIQIN